jgi:phage terminase large subunit-like protein
VTYDPYQLHYMAERLGDTVWCDPFGQMGPRLEADRLLLDLITHRRIAHAGTPVLREHLANADRKVDPDGRRLRIVKRQPHLKIDAAVCLSMAAARCLELAL